MVLFVATVFSYIVTSLTQTGPHDLVSGSLDSGLGITTGMCMRRSHIGPLVGNCVCCQCPLDVLADGISINRSLLKPGTGRNDGGTFRSVPPTKIRNSQLYVPQKSLQFSAIREHAAWQVV